MATDEVKTGWNWKYISLLLGASLLTGLVGYGLKYVLEPAIPPDYPTLHRPYLEAKLCIESVEATNFIIRYDIENVGKLPAESIRFITLTPQSKAAKLHAPKTSKLAPGGQMSLPVALPARTIAVDGPVVKLQLHLLYSAMIAGKEWDFVSRFDFVLEERFIQEGSLSYQRAFHEEGTIGDEQAFKIMGLKAALDEKTGTYAFWFKLPERDDGPAALLFESETKALVFDPRSKMLTLNRKQQNSLQQVWAYTLPPQTSRWYHIAISWDPERTSLYINGVGPGDLPAAQKADQDGNP